MLSSSDKLTEMQLELLRSFKHLINEKQISEVRSLLNFYFRKKLEESIEREEQNRNYTASVYEQWLAGSAK